MNSIIYVRLDFIQISSIDSSGCEDVRIRPIYRRSNDMADKFSDFVWKCASMNLPVFVFPTAIISYYNYFARDKMEQAFQLPITAM